MVLDGTQQLADRIRHASRISVLTGAGVSAASGVPTFRGQQGLWKTHRPEQLATPEAFAQNPTLVWEWYDWRRQVIAGCHPNRAHDVLAAWARRYPRFTLITQNVDGLHERAGTPNVLRLHGSIWHVSCWNQCPASPSRWRDETVPHPILPPPCPHCGGPTRPAVVWFGETLDFVNEAVEALNCDLFITVGTSAVVYPAAGLVHEARRLGAFTVEVNLEPTGSSGLVDLSLIGPAEEILDEAERLLIS